MPRAIDTILFSAVNPGAGGAVATIATGDAAIVRTFNPPAQAYLESLIRQGTTAGFLGVTSPELHDPVRGIRITPGESPALFALPAEYSEQLTSADTLTYTLAGGGAETDIGAAVVYYTDIGSNGAALYNPGDIAGNVAHIKPQAVAVTSNATAGQWQDVSLTTTENILHSKSQYAVLGYTTNAALGVIGIKGQCTGYLRVCGPGATFEAKTSNYFIAMSELTGRPHIPVFNASDAPNVFVSVAAAAASVSTVVELILAELIHPLA